ncbi:meiosis-specific with OB domain-containing protein [Cimex lectularius]|uniref:MEIOB-like N-terminal domain-containing protein n=1 Tax=Cimex lectularius TaxID=79782 RepID=A0A8I6RIT0_CIMLE|nr:meiosis-specific with OB domain-containing protein [Cimex lectularius]
MSAAGVKKMTLSTLTPTSVNFFIVGVIIAKRNPKTFISKKDGTERGVWGFTFRDSPTDYINVTAWGSPSYTEYLASSFRTGDVVDLINIRVSTRNPSDINSQYHPTVTSCLELVMNEHHSEITLHDAEDCINYIKLLHMPTKPPGNFLSLSEVKSNGSLLNDQFVNLLVAVQKVGVSHNYKTRFGNESVVLEFLVMDRTSTGFTIQLWNNELIERAKIWKPRFTILFLSDIKIKWNAFRRSLYGDIGPRTIVTENPDTKEAMALAQFASTAPLQPVAIVDMLAELMPLPETINNVMSCEAVINHARYGNNEKFTALVYALVESFDIDGITPIISSKCSLCKKIVGSVCDNPTCISRPDQTISILVNYDLRISLMDLTSILSNCRLTGNVAANVLGCVSEDFHMMVNEEKVSLKWKYLFKYVAARLLVMPSNDNPLVSVVSLNRISFTEFAQNLPIH